jgi:hypothetical protein
MKRAKEKSGFIRLVNKIALGKVLFKNQYESNMCLHTGAVLRNTQI